MTEDERKARRREAWTRYNRSPKGAARYKRYEDKNPDRAARWSVLMQMRKHGPPA